MGIGSKEQQPTVGKWASRRLTDQRNGALKTRIGCCDVLCGDYNRDPKTYYKECQLFRALCETLNAKP